MDKTIDILDSGVSYSRGWSNALRASIAALGRLKDDQEPTYRAGMQLAIELLTEMKIVVDKNRRPR